MIDSQLVGSVERGSPACLTNGGQEHLLFDSDVTQQPAPKVSEGFRIELRCLHRAVQQSVQSCVVGHQVVNDSPTHHGVPLTSITPAARRMSARTTLTRPSTEARRRSR